MALIKNIFEVKLSQTTAFKQLISNIGKIIRCCSIVLTNTEGISINELSNCKGVLVMIDLPINNFEKYVCNQSKVSIGINMETLQGALYLLGDQPIIIYMRHGEDRLLIKGSDKFSNEIELTVKLIDIPQSDLNLKIPLPTFQAEITIPRERFKAICSSMDCNKTYDKFKSMSSSLVGTKVGGSVKVKIVNNNISFATDYNKDISLALSHTESNGEPVKSGSNMVLGGLFNLKHLVIFGDCDKVCDKVKISMVNEFPLVLSMDISTLGKLTILMTHLGE